MRVLRTLLIAALFAGGLAGCSGTDSSDIPAAVSARLQHDVRDVARLAADHRYAAALTELRALRTAVREAVAAGDIGAARAARIGASLDLVQEDLTAKISSASPKPRTTSPSPRATAGPSAPTKDEQDKGEEAQKKAEEEAEKKAEEAEKKAEEEAKKNAEDAEKKDEEKKKDEEQKKGEEKGDD